MVARRTVALAAVVMAVVVGATTVTGNYTVAKDEVKQQYKDHAEESVENTKESAKWWAGWGRDRVKEGLGLKGDPAEDVDDNDRPPPGKAEEIGNKAAGKVGEGEKKANEIKDTVKQKQEGYDDANKMIGETINSAHGEREVDDISHCVSAGGLPVPKEEL